MLEEAEMSSEITLNLKKLRKHKEALEDGISSDFWKILKKELLGCVDACKENLSNPKVTDGKGGLERVRLLQTQIKVYRQILDIPTEVKGMIDNQLGDTELEPKEGANAKAR